MQTVVVKKGIPQGVESPSVNKGESEKKQKKGVEQWGD